MKMSFNSVIPPFLLIIAVGLTLFPLLNPGLPDVHDPTSAYRLATLVETIKDGQFPAAWNNSLNYGFGYPLHLYYAPLFSYLSALNYLIVHNHEVAIKLTIGLVSLVGSFGIYCSTLSNGRAVALLSSLAFTFLPYRASAIYVRGSYAEFLAMSLLPWLIFAWSRPLNSKKRLVVTSIITTAFILSHNTMFILLPPLLILISLIYQKSFFKNVLLTLTLSIGLASWALFPVLFERNLVQAQAIALKTNFQDHFVTLQQLWFSTWGYGGSSTGINDLMSFMLGKGQVVLALISVVFLIYKKKYQLLTIPLSITIFYLFFTQSISAPLWQLFSILSILQFPWRLLTYATVGLSLLTGYSLLAIPPQLRKLFVVIIVVLLINTNDQYFKPWNTLNYSPSALADQNNLNTLVSQKIPEYLPIAMPTFPTTPPTDGLSRTATRVFGSLNLSHSKSLIIHTAFMPQWQLKVNNRNTPIIASSDGLIQTTTSFPAGDYNLDLTWHRSLAENIGLIITAITTLIMVGLWLL